MSDPNSAPLDLRDEVLQSALQQHPLTTALFPGSDPKDLFAERLIWWRQFAAKAHATPFAPLELWTYPLALAQLLARKNPMIVGIAGAPGSGKSTLAAALRASFEARFPERRFVNISLDDFYYPKAKRESLGLRWRAQPGSHDLRAAVEALEHIRAGEKRIVLQTFDQQRDDRGADRIVAGPIAMAFVDGWFLGLRERGYEQVAASLDFLIYLDCPTDIARQRRFARESTIRESAPGSGLSENEMEQFWSEVLEPGIRDFVAPIAKLADLTITLDEEGKPIGARFR